MIEYYDFLLFATASAVVFGKVFFPSIDPVAGVIASFGALATGYLARPLGGAIFGHFGDLLGRKRMLVITMVMMGAGSVLIGLLPTYGQIGVAAPILLVLLRVVQGIAVGGEWGGSVLISAEHATSRRGLWTSFTASGASSGAVLSALALTVAANSMGEDQFLAWGWRIPFLFSAVLVGVGLFVRARVEETPEFSQERSRSSAPLMEVLRGHPRTLLLSIGMGLAPFVAQGTLTVYLISYGVQVGFARPEVLNVLTIASLISVGFMLAFGALSDRIGRRPVVITGAILMGAWAFAVLPLVGTGSFPLLLLALCVGLGILHPMMAGPMAALYAELFAVRVRYTGASVGYQIAAIGSGLAPLAFASISGAGGSPILISVVVATCCLLSIVCLQRLATARHTLASVPTASAAGPGATDREQAVTPRA